MHFAMTTKNQILTKAIEISSSRGLKEMSMSELAVECGLKKSSLYAHFASKDDIEEEALLLCGRILAKEIDQMVITKGSARDQLQSVAFFLYSLFVDSETGRCYTLIQSEKLRNITASKIYRQTFNMLTARCEVMMDIKLGLMDSHYPAMLFCSGLENLICLFLMRQKETEKWEEFSWEIEKYCDGFLNLTFSPKKECQPK